MKKLMKFVFESWTNYKIVIKDTIFILGRNLLQNKLEFKKCPTCKYTWENQSDFLSDSNLELIGYQANFANPGAGIILFNHSCHSTIALKVKSVENLYDGPIFKKNAAGDECPGFCLYKDNLEKCPVECECAFVREIIDIIKAWPKKPSNLPQAV